MESYYLHEFKITNTDIKEGSNKIMNVNSEEMLEMPIYGNAGESAIQDEKQQGDRGRQNPTWIVKEGKAAEIGELGLLTLSAVLKQDDLFWLDICTDQEIKE